MPLFLFTCRCLASEQTHRLTVVVVYAREGNTQRTSFAYRSEIDTEEKQKGMAATVKKMLTHDQLWEVLTDAPAEFTTPSTVQRYRNYTSADVGRARIHPGRAFDPTHREETHGDPANSGSDRSGELINPKPRTNFANRQFNINELVYDRNRQILRQEKSMPATIDKWKTSFGIVTQSSERAGDLINPKKTQPELEFEHEQPRSLYLLSHQSYEPGEQRERHYEKGDLIRKQTHGVPTPVYADGRFARESLTWIRPNHSTPVISQTVHEFDESRHDNAGVRTRRFLAATGLPFDHRFGLSTASDRQSAGEVVHQRLIPSTFDEKAQSALAQLRAQLCSLHMTTFKTQLQAFQYYDSDRDGFISTRELKLTIEKNFNLNLSDDLIAALMFQCDQDRDGQLNFLEFSNFLCYRVAHASGLESFVIEEKKKSNRSPMTMIKDSQGRPLLTIDDVVEATNGKFYPRKLISQIDEMVPDGWKTSYDKINEAPFRLEPEIKRTYGLPSINSQHHYAITSPDNRHRLPLGSNTIVGAILSPSIWSDRGLTEDDLLSPKTMEEIRNIFDKANVPVSGEDFVYAWTTAAGKNPRGEVSVGTFKQALDSKNRLLGNHEIVYA